MLLMRQFVYSQEGENATVPRNHPERASLATGSTNNTVKAVHTGACIDLDHMHDSGGEPSVAS